MSEEPSPEAVSRISADLGTALRRSRAAPSRVGLNPAITKVAVDLLNLEPENAEKTLSDSLEVIREAIGADSVCFALLTDDLLAFDRVSHASTVLAGCRPERLAGTRLEDVDWLKSKLGHMRLVEILDARRLSPALLGETRLLNEMGAGASLFAGLDINGRLGGVLGVLSARPVDSWHVDVYLLLKLVGASLSAALTRLKLGRELGDIHEREELTRYASNDGIWDFDVETNAIRFSPRWKIMMGYGEEEPDEDMPDWRQLVHPDDMVRVQGKIRDHLDGKSELFESVHRMRHRSGDWRWVMSRAKAMVDEEGRMLRLVGVELDITDQKLYEEALFREKQNAQITLQSIGDGVITTDSDCRIEYLNPVAQELTGWSLDDASGRGVDEIFRSFHEETCEPMENPLSVAIRRDRLYKSMRPTLLIRRDGNELYVESCAAPIRNDVGQVIGGVLVFHDVSEARELNRRLSYHASHDMLTGLVNRREFEARLERALKMGRAR